MMDISDGLASDIRHIMERSGVGAAIDTERIPAAADADIRTAACAGEDYVLLLTAECADAERLAADFLARFGAPLHPVGRITDGRELEWFENGTPPPPRLARLHALLTFPQPPTGKSPRKTSKPKNRPTAPTKNTPQRIGNRTNRPPKAGGGESATEQTGNQTDRESHRPPGQTNRPAYHLSANVSPFDNISSLSRPQQKKRHPNKPLPIAPPGISPLGRHIVPRQPYRPSAAITKNSGPKAAAFH